jgi:hypothetical protein
MAEDPKNTKKKFQKFCEGMDIADLMRKMMEGKKAGLPFNCEGMMSQMMQKCCGGKKAKEEPTPETKENPAPGQ